MLIILQYIKLIKWINLTQFQGYSPLHDPSLKDVMSEMLPRYKNWYIQRDLCLIYSEFQNAIEALIVHCLSIRHGKVQRAACERFS